MDDKNIQIVRKIIGHAEKVLSYCSEICNDNDFLADAQLIDACVFNLMQIGESTCRLDDDFMAARTNIPWQKMRGLRNRIVHDYDGVDHHLIWDIISNDLLDLIQGLNDIAGHPK